MRLVYVIGDSYRRQRAGDRGGQGEGGRERMGRGDRSYIFSIINLLSWEKTLISRGVQGEDEGTSWPTVILDETGILGKSKKSFRYFYSPVLVLARVCACEDAISYTYVPKNISLKKKI